MKFIVPDTVRLELANGHWIEVKKDLSALEEKRFRSAGMKRMTPRQGEGEGATNEIEIDWVELAKARLTAYVVDWSAKKPDGSKLPFNADAVKLLTRESFDEIDAAILAHIEKVDEEKKAQSGRPTLTAV